MTTILADWRLGVLVADSSVSDDDRVWSDRKTYRHQGAIYGFSGDVAEAILFMQWIKGRGKPPKFTGSDCLKLSPDGLFHFNGSTVAHQVSNGVEAIGSGGKAAICTYEALDWTDPAQAVRIVCKHDAGSRGPVRVYRLPGASLPHNKSTRSQHSLRHDGRNTR